MPHKVSQETRKKLVEEYLSGKNLSDSAKPFGLSFKATFNAIREAGIPARKNDGWNRVHKVNEYFFNQIDSEIKSYWLGFLAADGYVDKENNRVSLRLKQSDKSHIEKFRRDIGSEHRITDHERMGLNGKIFASCINVSSKKMVESLEKLGIHPNKTFTLKTPQIEEKLARHFWRGVVDGDGCISKVKGGRSQFHIHLVGTFDICTSFREFILKNTGFAGTLRPHGKIFRVCWSNLAANKAICNLLYGDSVIFLDRKKKLAELVLKSERGVPGKKRDPREK